MVTKLMVAKTAKAPVRRKPNSKDDVKKASTVAMPRLADNYNQTLL